MLRCMCAESPPSLHVLHVQPSIWDGMYSALQLLRSQEEKTRAERGAVGVTASAEKHAGCQAAYGTLGFVCISECFVCKSKSLTYLWECGRQRRSREAPAAIWEPWDFHLRQWDCCLSDTHVHKHPPLRRLLPTYCWHPQLRRSYF